MEQEQSLTKFDEICKLISAVKLPTTELHLHLDGSLTPAFIFAQAKKLQQQQQQKNDGSSIAVVELPVLTPDELRPFLMHQKTTHHINTGTKAERNGNWPIFDFCNQFLQCKEGIYNYIINFFFFFFFFNSSFVHYY